MLRKLLISIRNKLPDAKNELPMWKNFLRSMGLLALAMLIALYSTSAARSGDMTAAVIAALMALGIAAWVGIRFVPRLARGVDWGWLPFLTQYKITRDGGIFVGALLVVTSAAINTSNNLLYMVLSALLAVVLLSGLLSAMNFKFLEMDVILPSRVFAKETVPLSVRIRNPRKFFPAFSLRTEPPGQSLYFSVVQPSGTAVHYGETRFPKRGRYTIDKLKTASRFPFGFFSKSRSYAVESECICYPEILPPDSLDISVADILGSHQRLERGLGSDLYTIRDYVPSDSARHVHWKASAKTATLKTREFAAEESRRVLLAFDRFGNARDAERFEHLVTQAASLAFHLIKSGAEVLLVSDEWELASGASGSMLDEMLQYFALVEMSPSANAPDFDPQGGALLFSLRGGSR
jgi:uncharacterized protein (DUF58 family)